MFRLPKTFKQKKRAFYKFQIAKIQRGIWDMELRITTIEEIKEGIRRNFEDVSAMIKGNEEIIEKSFEKLGIEVKDPARDYITLREELEKVQKTFTELELAGLNPEARENAINTFAKESRVLRMDWLKEKIGIETKYHGEERTKKQEEFSKVMNKMLQLTELKQGLETDATHLTEQMKGKWNEKENAYLGGLDQEIKVIKDKIDGARAFQVLVNDELKKI